MNKEQSYQRYQRQIQLKEFGIEGQQKLLDAKVLVIGAGGLGCPVLQYLAAAGVGTIGIADDDVIELSNLQRQPLYAANETGLSKAITAKEKLRQLNPEINIIAYDERLTAANTLSIIEKYDVVIDGTDNFATRYMINDACVILNKPLVFGAISKFEGQVAIFNCKQNNIAVNYRDLFPNPPKDGEVPGCAETGVLGVLPGIIGTMMANETIKLIAGIGKPLINRMFTYNALTNQSYEAGLNVNTESASLIPKSAAVFMQTDYAWLCATESSLQFEIDAEKFDSIIAATEVDIIDVRELDEAPAVTEFTFTQVPLSQLKENVSKIKRGTVICFCQSGKRSLQASQLLFDSFGKTKNIYSLRGGIPAWKKLHQKRFL
jgi:sulfur-carrier protein adenylyltransferase/sulfurtransferase